MPVQRRRITPVTRRDRQHPNTIPNCQVSAADCRHALLQLAVHSISLILTDPPYFTDGIDPVWHHQHLRSRVKPGVISRLPAGMKFTSDQE